MLRSQELAQAFIPVKQLEVMPEVQQDLTPGALTQLRMVVPGYLGFMNPADTRLQYELTMAGRGQPHPNPRAGAHAVWKNLRIQDGGGQTTLEEISDYNVLVAQTWGYSQNDSISQKRALFEGRQQDPSKDHNIFWAGAEAWQDGAVTAAKTPNTLQMEHQIHSGIFQSDKVFPLVASGGLRVQMEIEATQQALVYATGSEGTDYGTALANAYHLAVALSIGDDDKSAIDDEFSVIVQLNSVASTGIGPYASAAPWNNNAWSIGDMLYVADSGTAYTNEEELGIITSFDIDTTRLKVSYIPNRAFGDKLTKNHVIGSALYVKMADRLYGLTVANTNMPDPQITLVAVATSYTISNVKLLTSVVSPPEPYVKAMLEQAQSEKGLALDIKTWTLVRSNLNAQRGITSQMIPTTETRVYSVLSVPLAQEYQGQLTLDSLGGVVDFGQDYQYVFGGQLVPDRNISLARYSQTVPRSDALHLMELEKALANCGVPVRDLQRAPQKFLIGRAWSRYGQVADLSVRDLSLRVNYSSSASLTKLFEHYICHLRRVVFSTAGVRAF